MPAEWTAPDGDLQPAVVRRGVVLDHGRALCAWNVERRPMHRHEAASGRDWLPPTRPAQPNVGGADTALH